MMALVTGGASSGKSAYAENLALTLPGPHVYAATMRHGDSETESRIARHRALRAGKGFETCELAGADRNAGIPQQGTVLVEDLGNLVLNGLEDALDDLLACDNAVVVANEIGCDGGAYDDFTRSYIDKLGALSCKIASHADLVVEVVAGIPNAVKGQLP